MAWCAHCMIVIIFNLKSIHATQRSLELPEREPVPEYLSQTERTKTMASLHRTVYKQGTVTGPGSSIRWTTPNGSFAANRGMRVRAVQPITSSLHGVAASICGRKRRHAISYCPLPHVWPSVFAYAPHPVLPAVSVRPILEKCRVWHESPT